MVASYYEKTKVNLIWQTAYQIIIMVLGVLLPYLIINEYGAEVNGLTATINQIMIVVTLAKSGISTSLTYSLYKPIREEDRRETAIILQRVKKAFRIVGIITVVVGGCASVLLSFLNTEEIGQGYLLIASLLTCMNTAMDLTFTAVYNVYFTASQEKYIISKGLIIAGILTYGLEFFVVLTHTNFIFLYGCAIIGCLAKILYLGKEFKKRNVQVLTENHYTDTNTDKLFGAGWATINEMAHTAVASSTTIITTYCCGLVYSSILSIYMLAVNALTSFAQVVYTSVAPSFGAIAAEKNVNKLNNAFDMFQFSYTMLVTFMFMCASVLLLPFVKIYTKSAQDVNYLNDVLGIETIIYGVFFSLRAPYNIIVSATGKFKPSGIQTGITAIFSIVLSVLLAKIEYTYVIIGPILFYGANAVYQHFMLKKRVIGFDNSRFGNHICVLVISIGSITLLTKAVGYEPKTMIEWFSYAIISAGISALIMYVVIQTLDKDSFKNLLTYLKKKNRVS